MIKQQNEVKKRQNNFRVEQENKMKNQIGLQSKRLAKEVTGKPSVEDVESINSPLAQTMLESLPATKPKKLRDMFPTASDDAIDLLKNLLQFNPGKRLTAE